MEKVTKKLRNILKSKESPNLLYKQTNKKRASLFVDDLSKK